MKPEEAIDIIKSNSPDKGRYTMLSDALETAIDALNNAKLKANGIRCYAINLILPRGFRWLLPFIKIDVKKFDGRPVITGQKVNCIIVDEVN